MEIERSCSDCKYYFCVTPPLLELLKLKMVLVNIQQYCNVTYIVIWLSFTDPRILRRLSVSAPSRTPLSPFFARSLSSSWTMKPLIEFSQKDRPFICAKSLPHKEACSVLRTWYWNSSSIEVRWEGHSRISLVTRNYNKRIKTIRRKSREKKKGPPNTYPPFNPTAISSHSFCPPCFTTVWTIPFELYLNTISFTFPRITDMRSLTCFWRSEVGMVFCMTSDNTFLASTSSGE